MSWANTSLPEYMIGIPGEKTPVSQKIHVQVGDTPKHAISYSRSTCYITVLMKLPDTTEIHYEKARHLSGPDVEPIDVKLTVSEEKKSKWEWKSLVEATYRRVAALANEGLAQVDIAAELNIHKSTVSRAWWTAKEEGLIPKKNYR